MKIIYSPVHQKHRPPWEFINFQKFKHAEVPERIESIAKTLRENGLEEYFIEPKQFSFSHIQKLHHENYIEYVKKNADAQKMDEAYYSSNYIMDNYTPIMHHTFDAAVEAVNCALTGASIIEKEKIVYALCRPPGHHAEKNIMGGYCYFNNAAIAAEYLSQKGKVAILDIDFHHGNGTQRLFYDRPDVLYVSLHADPKIMFPYISGFTDELGVGKGEGFNYNFPLPMGTDNERYEQTLLKALQIIREFKPHNLIVSCGFDTYEHDPIGGFKVTYTFYETIARHIMSLNYPTLVIQEGGYHVDDLGKIAYSFTKGLLI